VAVTTLRSSFSPLAIEAGARSDLTEKRRTANCRMSADFVSILNEQIELIFWYSHIGITNLAKSELLSRAALQ
jgi:hypothetical protein